MSTISKLRECTSIAEADGILSSVRAGPAIKKLVETGKIEVLDEADRPEAGGKRSTRVQKSTHGHPATKKVSTRGDR